ncbi:HNH endonuclease [Jeotgalibaca porci]|uniref:HNH endonuclease n=1 Tax=Jeotgalibaca porci TaxID=1868793 RepID=UPI0035A05F88
MRIEAKERQKRNAIASIAKLLNKEVLRRERVVELTRPCVECGTPFYNPHPLALTCTPLCSRRRANRHLRLYNSKRLNESNIVDKDITVQKLFNKYDGVCYLCGKKCDFNDKVITEEGYTIVGKTYPSIEHVTPISKGGLHSWDNVNLAHHYCNTLKSNKI